MSSEHGTVTAEPQVSHKDICVRFTITEGLFRCGYEAVGFLEEGESLVTLKEAHRRVGARVVTSDEDWERIYRNRGQLPGALFRYVRLLSKRLQNSGAGGKYSSLRLRRRNEWIEYTTDLGIYYCHRGELILRRSA